MATLWPAGTRTASGNLSWVKPTMAGVVLQAPSHARTGAKRVVATSVRVTRFFMIFVPNGHARHGHGECYAEPLAADAGRGSIRRYQRSV